MSDPSIDDEDVPNAHTDLSISSIGVPPYSCRGATESLKPISQASQNKRTINGVFKDTSFDGFKKFAYSASCQDQEPPAFDGVWPGRRIIVDCITEMSYKTFGGSPARPVVPGSPRVSGNYTIYRPRIVVIVTDFNVERDEYGAAISWTLDGEEE